MYLDSSALTKLVVAEPDSDGLGSFVSDRDIYSSRVAFVEVMKAVARHDPEADPTALFARISWVELDEDVARAAGGAGGATLRALEAIHVASALRLATDIEAFVTYDTRQAAAAQAVGLRVLAPTDRVA